jgi:hypothetical protein
MLNQMVLTTCFLVLEYSYYIKVFLNLNLFYIAYPDFFTVFPRFVSYLRKYFAK